MVGAPVWGDKVGERGVAVEAEVDSEGDGDDGEDDEEQY